MLSNSGILYRYWYARRLKAKSLSIYGLAHHLDVTKKLDLFGATGPTKTLKQNIREPVTAISKLQAVIYISSFILCWLLAVADRTYPSFTGKTSFTLTFLYAAIVPLQGFINAIIYGKLHLWVVRHERHMGTATIFVTTFDMDWTSCPTNLEDWIPAGKDLYVFSLQHCVEVQAIEQVIRGYLLQVSVSVSNRFVKNADDASGNVKLELLMGESGPSKRLLMKLLVSPSGTSTCPSYLSRAILALRSSTARNDCVELGKIMCC
ncbi:unnamed protein product [Peronospora belbahrii]|uniref:Uncharacterized protein n=1 Tax=Peronospora belbahrii TaxID=622444 RepID=A0ABN8DCC6_9STRA|nr:unnamed protein product [Peronospora belbahrii]